MNTQEKYKRYAAFKNRLYRLGLTSKQYDAIIAAVCEVLDL